MAVGTSSSNSLYNLFGGFLYFPFVSTPTVSATGGNTQVALTWSSADASTGWVVGGYTMGQSTISGGPYTHTSVGNILSSTITGLMNGTSYYFVVIVEDALGNFIATSTEVSATPTVPAPGGGGGGGGSPNNNSPVGSITFSGRAYPRSTITILKDAQVALTTVTDANSQFSATLSNLSTGNYFFSVYGEDNSGNRSSLLTFPISVTSGVSNNVAGIFIAPTTAIDKSQVKKGDDIAIFGQTTNAGEVTIQVNSDEPYFVKTTADATGVYLYNFDTSPLEYGNHSTKSKTAKGNEISSYGVATPFIVGTSNILAEAKEKPIQKNGDTNNDNKVNLIDFSIAAYWYNRPNPPKGADANGDGKVNLIDFPDVWRLWEFWYEQKFFGKITFSP